MLDSQDRPEMWSGADDMRRGTSEFVGKPRETSEDLGKPRKTSEDLRRVSEESRESLGYLVQSNRGNPRKSLGKVSGKYRKSLGKMQRKLIGGSAEAVAVNRYAKSPPEGVGLSGRGLPEV
eukprot:gene13795-biopygen4442